MIERTIKDILADAVPGILWTVNYLASGVSDASTVYYEGGRDPGQYDVGMRRPLYMVYVRHSDFREAENIAQIVFDTIERQGDFLATETRGGRSFKYRVMALNPDEPIRVGENADTGEMEYSVNIQGYLIEEA